eukprot:PITA_05078
MDSVQLLRVVMASMEIRKFLAIVLLLHNLLPIAMGANGHILREYIGAFGNGVKFSDVPINPAVEVHFILSFAIDYTTGSASPSPTNGKFNIFWDTGSLTPKAVQAIKAQHKNVKVALSLGGDSVGNGHPVQFKPSSVSSWVNNAVTSLSKIIKEYHLDGIDIDYEHFQADDNTFVNCIGQLITRLKQSKVISFASIAPFEDRGAVQSHYTALWGKYGHVIDYVNFQFYAYDASTTVSQFIQHYNTQASLYKGGRILVSFSTDNGAGGLLPDHGFFQACKMLKQKGELQGIFVWSADNSKSKGFKYEKQAEPLLA